MGLAQDVIAALHTAIDDEVEFTEARLAALEDTEFLEYLGGAGELEIITERAWSTSTGAQPWSKQPGIPTAQSTVQEIDAWCAAHVLPLIDKAKVEFTRGMKKVGESAKSAKVLVDVKTPTSIKSKIQRGKAITHMHDILRGAILVKKSEDVDKVRAAMRKTFTLFEEETKDFGKDQEFGYYGSTHYLVELSNKVLAEVQLMTKELWSVKNAAHAIYDLEREKVAADKSYANTPQFKTQQKTSRDLFLRGSGNKKIRIAQGPNLQYGKDGNKPPVR